jgi:hypothetical protein
MTSKAHWVADPRAKGGRILVETLDTPGAGEQTVKRGQKQNSRKPQWVKLPTYWIEQLKRARRSATYRLALHILEEVNRQPYTGEKIVLSAAATGLPRSTRRVAIKEIVDLKLVKIQRDGNRTIQVTELFWHNPSAR